MIQLGIFNLFKPTIFFRSRSLILCRQNTALPIIRRQLSRTLVGNWTLVYDKSIGEDTTSKITGGTVSMSSYVLTGKSIQDAICPTIYDRITISGEYGEAKLVEMKTSDGRPIASLNGNARCSLN